MNKKLEMEVLKRLQSVTSTDIDKINAESQTGKESQNYKQSKWDLVDLDESDNAFGEKSTENVEPKRFKLRHKKSLSDSNFEKFLKNTKEKYEENDSSRYYRSDSSSSQGGQMYIMEPWNDNSIVGGSD